MELTAQDVRLVEEAQALVDRRGDGVVHTVAAGILAADGGLVTALNLYHFTGGPCAEIAALARHAAEATGPPAVVVAVGDNGRGVLPPCGRCRQVLYDYAPDCDVILPYRESLLRRPIRSLLPHTYDWNAHQ